jgi:FkbM family methyltransferase
MREQVTAALDRAVMADHIGAVLRRHRIGTVLDVGAHTGQYGSFLRGLGYDGAIVSYEPVPETFAQLEEASAADEGWTAHRLALGDTDGSATIHVARSSDFSSLRRISDYGTTTFADATHVERREAVESRRLDGVLGEHAPGAATPMLLKLDTQGWDMQVLDGATGILGDVAAVQTEVALQPIYEDVPSLDEVVAELSGRGFAPSGFFPVTRDADLRLVEVDLVAVRRAG